MRWRGGGGRTESLRCRDFVVLFPLWEELLEYLCTDIGMSHLLWFPNVVLICQMIEQENSTRNDRDECSLEADNTTKRVVDCMLCLFGVSSNVVQGIGIALVAIHLCSVRALAPKAAANEKTLPAYLDEESN